MAAASLSRSRAVAGGLYFLFTLLCLLCFASSLISNDQLKNDKEAIHNTQQDLAKLKAEWNTLFKRTSALKCFIEPSVALIKKCSEESPDDFLTLKGIMEGIMEQSKTQDAQAEAIDANIVKLEQDLGEWKTIINAVEEYHAEL